jgi:hypothetical protein
VADSYYVLAREALTAPLPAVGRILAPITGEVAFDVTRRLRGGVGVLASGLTRQQADRAAAELGQAGVRAFALSETDWVAFPEPVFLESARLGEEALEVTDLRGRRGERLGSTRLPYDDLVLLVTAHVRTETQKRVVRQKQGGGSGAMSLVGLGGSGARLGGIARAIDEMIPEIRYETHAEYDHLLDLFAVEPAHHLRLNAGTFNFSQTGLEVQPTSILNLGAFIRALASLCHDAAADPSIRHILDGNPHTNLRFNSPDQYDTYLAWRVQLLYHPEET